MAEPLYLTDEFGNKYRNPKTFSSTTGQEYASPWSGQVSSNTVVTPSSGLAASYGLNADNTYGYIDPASKQFEYAQLNDAQADAVKNPFVSDGTTLNFGANADQGWWTQNKDMVTGIGSGIQGLAALAGAYTGYKNYQLGKDSFAFESNLARQNYENAAKQYNAAVDRGASVTQGLAGDRIADKAAFDAKVQNEKVKQTL